MHVGIILDSEPHRTKPNGLQVAADQEVDAGKIEGIIAACPSLGIEILTLFVARTKHTRFERSEAIGSIGGLHEFLNANFLVLQKTNVKVSFLGDLELLDTETRFFLSNIEAATKNNTGMVLNLAVNYSGRNDLARAIRKLAQASKSGDIEAREIDEDYISKALDTSGQSDPDLIIRTSNGVGISNFLIWQSAYTELFFFKDGWAHFTIETFKSAIRAYHSRTRQFGGLPAKPPSKKRALKRLAR